MSDVMSDDRPAARPSWQKWAGGSGGAAVVVGFGDLFRRFEEAKASTAAIRQAAFDKASQAGALQEALATCQATIVEVVRTCGS